MGIEVKRAAGAMINFEMNVAEELLREDVGPTVIAQIVKRRLEGFKAREGLDANGNDEGNKASD